MADIKAALTAGEWEKGTASDRHSVSVRRGSEGGVFVRDEDGPHEIPVARRHALAALALHGQPFGFTWEDVEMLRREAAVQRESLRRFDVQAQLQAPAANAAELRSMFVNGIKRKLNLADRIEALLPPRTPEGQ